MFVKGKCCAHAVHMGAISVLTSFVVLLSCGWWDVDFNPVVMFLVINSACLFLQGGKNL